MSRIACTLLLAAALPLTACSSASGGAGATPKPDMVTPVGLTTTVTRELGISEVQANAAIGSMLGQAKTKLPPEDFTKLSSAIPGADSYLSAASAAGVGPAEGAAVDSATAGAAGAASNTDVLNAALAKLQIPPESAEKLVPVVTEYVNQVGGPKVAGLLKGLY
jgi:Protein of unknown function VcgC/VcgE (DUF2780)